MDSFLDLILMSSAMRVEEFRPTIAIVDTLKVNLFVLEMRIILEYMIVRSTYVLLEWWRWRRLAAILK